MRIAPNPDFRQMYNRCVASVAIDRRRPQPGHGQAHPPTVLTGIGHGFFGDEIAVVDNPAFRVKLSQILFSTIRCTHAHAGCLERM